jgi:hypothetical protein
MMKSPIVHPELLVSSARELIRINEALYRETAETTDPLVREMLSKATSCIDNVALGLDELAMLDRNVPRG